MGRLLSSAYNFRSITNNTVDKLTTIAGGALCLPSILTTALLEPQRALKGIASYVLNSAKQQLAQITNLITYQLTYIVNQIGNKVIGVLRQVQQLVNDIRSTVELVDDLKKTLTKRAGDILQFTNNKQNCEMFAAMLARCIQTRVGAEFNRRLQKELYNNNPLDDVVKKITSQIDKGENVFQGFVDTYTKKVDKATTQISKVNRLATDFTYSNTGQFNK